MNIQMMISICFHVVTEAVLLNNLLLMYEMLAGILHSIYRSMSRLSRLEANALGTVQNPVTHIFLSKFRQKKFCERERLVASRPRCMPLRLLWYDRSNLR